MAMVAMSLLMAGTGQALVLSGTYLDVGVSDGGGLVDLTAVQGITYKPGPLPNDYSLPGTPFEFVSLRVNGVTQTSGVPGFSANPWGLTLVNESVGTFNGVHTFGAPFLIGGSLVQYLETIGFNDVDKKIGISMKIINQSPSALTGVYISRGLDPDQDYNLYTTYATTNVIPGMASTMVSATGLNTGLFVNMDAFPESGAVAAISGNSGGLWSTEPTVLVAGGLVGGAVAGNPNDYSINLTWFLGDIPYGESRTIDMEYSFGQVPVPPSVLLLGSGLLGLAGLGWRRRKTS